jgi:hypothetical protein
MGSCCSPTGVCYSEMAAVQMHGALDEQLLCGRASPTCRTC